MQIPPEDIQWEGEDPGLPHGGGHGGQARGPKKPSSRGGPGTGRGRPMKSQPKKDFLPAQNGNAQRVSDDIELLNTDALVKEVCIMDVSKISSYYVSFYNTLHFSALVISGGDRFQHKSSRSF